MVFHCRPIFPADFLTRQRNRKLNFNFDEQLNQNNNPFEWHTHIDYEKKRQKKKAKEKPNRLNRENKVGQRDTKWKYLHESASDGKVKNRQL